MLLTFLILNYGCINLKVFTTEQLMTFTSYDEMANQLLEQKMSNTYTHVQRNTPSLWRRLYCDLFVLRLSCFRYILGDPLRLFEKHIYFSSQQDII